MESPAYWLDTTGEPTLGVAICGRCSAKLPLAQLYSDPNAPGLMVCIDDLDVLDPWRLPARETELINLPFVRPDTDVSVPAALAAQDTQAIANPPSVQDVLAWAIRTDKGQAILDSSGNYIDQSYPPNPLDLP